LQATSVAPVDIWGRGAPVALHTGAAVFQVVYCAEVSSMALVLRVTPFILIFVADGVLRWTHWQALGILLIPLDGIPFPGTTARVFAITNLIMLRALNLAIAT
jgi:hypothetical protein